MMEGAVNETIYKVVDKLWQTRLLADETIGLVQLIHDEAYPVFLSMKCVDNPTTRTNRSHTLTFADLTRKIRKEWEKEQIEPPDDMEAVNQAKGYLEAMRREVNRLIDEAESRMFAKYFATKITTNFLNNFYEGKLGDSDEFMKSLEYVIRSYGISNHKEMIRIALEDVKRFSADITKQVQASLDSMMHIERHYVPLTLEFEKALMNLVHKKMDFPSQIIPNKRKALLHFSELLMHIHPVPKFSLLYNSTRDGFETQKFHALCDNKGATLTIIQSTEGLIFGGYANKPWSTSNQFYPDEHAFLFSWDWKETYKQFQHHHKAVYHNAGCGPAFGAGPDLLVADRANTNSSSIMNINSTFFTHGRPMEQIAGGKNFSVRCYEVFLVD